MITLTVTPDGGEPYELTATSRDVLQWEKTHRGASFSRLSQNLNMVELYQLMHIAARRQGIFAGTLDEFEKTVELRLPEDVEAPDPTP